MRAETPGIAGHHQVAVNIAQSQRGIDIRIRRTQNSVSQNITLAWILAIDQVVQQIIPALVFPPTQQNSVEARLSNRFHIHHPVRNRSAPYIEAGIHGTQENRLKIGVRCAESHIPLIE